jgi:hypothetical protein
MGYPAVRSQLSSSLIFPHLHALADARKVHVPSRFPLRTVDSQALARPDSSMASIQPLPKAAPHRSRQPFGHSLEPL